MKHADNKTPEQTKGAARTEHAPDEYLLNWTKDKLPGSKNFWVSDVDLCIRDRRNNLMIVEVKRFKAVLSASQRITYLLLDGLIRKALRDGPKVKLKDDNVMSCQYAGFFVLQFERTNFSDGKAYIDGKQMTEREVIQLFSFRKTVKQIFEARDKKESLRRIKERKGIKVA